MAWPPPVLPVNRTNATPQIDTHPADHNAVNLAMNDTVAQVQTLGNPWRPTTTVYASIPAAALSGAAQDVPLQNVAGNLANYVSYNGHPAVQLTRAALITGILHIAMAAPAASGGVLVYTVYGGIYATQVQLPIIAGVPMDVDIPLTENLAAGQNIYWQIAGIGTAQSLTAGTLRLWEVGPFGNTVRT